VKAAAGVQIRVILYREVETVLADLASNKSKQEFMSIHPNVAVLRHPNHISLNPYESALYWSHHDKVAVYVHLNSAWLFMHTALNNACTKRTSAAASLAHRWRERLAREAHELAGVTRARQARPLSACTCVCCSCLYSHTFLVLCSYA
jgi:hypothetical protein